MNYARNIDDLGRVVIPKDIRNIHGIKSGDSLEISVTEKGILIIKHNEN